MSQTNDSTARLRVPADLWDEYRALCHEHDTTASSALRQHIRDAVRRRRATRTDPPRRS